RRRTTLVDAQLFKLDIEHPGEIFQRQPMAAPELCNRACVAAPSRMLEHMRECSAHAPAPVAREAPPDGGTGNSRSSPLDYHRSAGTVTRAKAGLQPSEGAPQTRRLQPPT